MIASLSMLATPIYAAADVLQLEQFDAEVSQALVLWIPSERGVLPQEKKLAQQLAQQGVSVWLPDIFESYFLPIAPSSIQKVPVEDLHDLLLLFLKTTPQKPHYVITSNRGASLALRVLNSKAPASWQGLGLILLNPNLYVSTPEPGQVAQYWPEVAQTNMPIFIRQAELSPWRWQLETLLSKFSLAGSDVFVQLQPKLRDRYYFRADASEFEQQQATRLALELVESMALLAPYLQTSRLVMPIHESLQRGTQKTPERKVGLQVYSGGAENSLSLPNLDGEQVDLKSQRGKVILLNFWASWCPPCVHEMPSMANLKRQLLQQPFEILAVNLAEDKGVVQQFKADKNLNFPILLDEHGIAVKAWNIFAYPSSYLIDKRGRIRYALFGSYDWQQPEALQVIEDLLSEK